MEFKGTKIVIAKDLADLHRQAADWIAQCIAGRARDEKHVTLCLSGGTTPVGLYERLSAGGFPEEIPWSRVHLFWGDERCVSPDDPDSNYHTVQESLISRVPIRPENIHRMRGEEADPEKAAEEYERELREFFQPPPGQWPAFDLMLLGIGSDGHTASLFPGSSALHEARRWVAAPRIEKFKARRLTLTPPVFNHARCVVFLAAGEEKAETLRDLLSADHAGSRTPFRWIRPHTGRLVFFLDQSAARWIGHGGKG
jgi:6-phosphogluconolactonase